MGLEFLARVRRTSTWLGGVMALMAATYVSPMRGLAFAAGALWSLVNLQLLERLVVGLMSPQRSDPTSDERATPANTRRVGFALLGMLFLFAAGAVLLRLLPPLVLVCGFALPLAVIVAKAGTQILIGSRLWASLVNHRFRAAFAALALATVAWFALGALTSVGSATHIRAVPNEVQASGALAAAAEGEHAADATGGGEGAGSGERQGPAGFANIIGLIAGANPHAPWAHFLEHYEVLVFSLLIALILLAVAFAASRNPQLVPSGLQNGVEMVVEGLAAFIGSILGPANGPRFVPFLGTLFIYILSMNLFGLIPFMHSPTASLNVTVALALTVFVYVQFIGFKELGPLGWLDHMLGNPRNVTGWMLAPLMLPIHVLGELAKPISLSCRLFGNVFGEDMLLVAFAALGLGLLPFKQLPFGVPMHVVFFPLVLLGSALQAMVFTVLSSIYILLMLPHEHHGEHGHGEATQHAH